MSILTSTWIQLKTPNTCNEIAHIASSMGNRLSSFTNTVPQGTDTSGPSAASLEKKVRASSSQEDTCIICIDDSDDERSTLQCGHRFHTECVKPWMERWQTCPLCRKRDTITFPPISCHSNCLISINHVSPNTFSSRVVDSLEATIMRMMEEHLTNHNRLVNTYNQHQQPPPFIGPITYQDAVARRNLQIENGILISQISPPRQITDNDDHQWEQLEPIL